MAVKKSGKARGFDRDKVSRATAMLLEAVGEDASREGLRDTPRRVADLYEEILSGMWEDPGAHLTPIKSESDHDLVVVKEIDFASICEHHLLPFVGTVGVAYVPRARRIVGISKVVRAVESIARRPQIQERMTRQIVEVIADQLKPAGVLAVVEAEHLCMSIRGVRKPGSRIVTTEARGLLKEPERQALALSALNR
jgi:GTP cyclohydrolase I